MEVMDLIRERRSIRSYDGRVVETEKLEKVLEAGRLARPSAICMNGNLLWYRAHAWRRCVKPAPASAWCRRPERLS